MKEEEQQQGNAKSLWKLLSPHKPQKSSFIYLAVLVVIATGLELILPLYPLNASSPQLSTYISLLDILTLMTVVWLLVNSVFYTSFIERQKRSPKLG